MMLSTCLRQAFDKYYYTVGRKPKNFLLPAFRHEEWVKECEANCIYSFTITETGLHNSIYGVPVIFHNKDYIELS